MKERLEKQIFKNTLLFFLYIFLIEMIIRFNTRSIFFSWDTLRIGVSSLIISILISIFLTIFKNILKKIVGTTISLILMIYAFMEVNLFFYLGFFMGIGNAEQGFKVIDYFKEFFSSVRLSTYLIIILFIIFNVYYLYIDKKIKERRLSNTKYFKFEIESIKNKSLVYALTILTILLLSLSYYGTLQSKRMQNKLQSINNINLLINPENSNLSVSQFGVYVYGISDLISNIFKLEEKFEFDYIKKEHNSYVTDDTRYIDDYSWNALIENENNYTYNNLNNYFINREITPKNKYTGYFEGKNLIFILMESVGEMIIHPELFPNFYKLYSDGMTFTNNYSPRNSCATGNNELTSMTSLYTINNTCNANTYKRNTYSQSIFNAFNNIGYVTSSYHNYAEFYYSRRVIHSNMGSGAYRNVTDLGIMWSALYEEWPSDVELIEKAVPYFIEEDKFMAYLTTVTAHQPYSVSSTYGNKNLELLDDYDYSLPLKRYFSKLIEFDNSLGLLLDMLKEKDKLDDTVIVLTGDHYPYGLADKYINEALNYDVTINNEVDRTPLIIYNSLAEPKQIDKYTSIIDILPTILNLFNIKYDPRLYFGNDILSDYRDLVVFADGSWQNKVGFYKSTNRRFISNSDDNVYTNDEIKQINKEIDLKRKMSTLAIRNNYFDYLNKGLNKYKKEDITQEELTEE